MLILCLVRACAEEGIFILTLAMVRALIRLAWYRAAIQVSIALCPEGEALRSQQI
jgi:hypothetical protein